MIVSVEELEALLGAVEQGETIVELLTAYAASTSHRDAPLRDFLSERFEVLPVPSLVKASFTRATDAMARELFPTSEDSAVS